MGCIVASHHASRHHLSMASASAGFGPGRFGDRSNHESLQEKRDGGDKLLIREKDREVCRPLSAGTFDRSENELEFSWDKRVLPVCAANGGGSLPPRHRNAHCQLQQVTSTHAPWLEVERHQDDTLIGIAHVDPKIRLTTLLNCSRAVRPVRNGPVGNRLGVRHRRSNVRQSVADSGNRRHGHRTTCGESAGQKAIVSCESVGNSMVGSGAVSKTAALTGRWHFEMAKRDSPIGSSGRMPLPGELRR